MSVIREADVIASVADALQYISYYHPMDYIEALGEAYRIEQSPALWFTFATLALSHFWKAFTGGYLNMAPEKLKAQVQTDFFALIARAIAMQTIAHAGLGFALVPIMALVLTHIEVWPELQATMQQDCQARQRA